MSTVHESANDIAANMKISRNAASGAAIARLIAENVFSFIFRTSYPRRLCLPRVVINAAGSASRSARDPTAEQPPELSAAGSALAVTVK